MSLNYTQIYDHESKLLSDIFKPKSVMLNMDEFGWVALEKLVKMKIWRNYWDSVLLVRRDLRKYNPGVKFIYESDMFDPNHNAKPNYYLVKGDYTDHGNISRKTL
jgi:hypothetical protein